MDPMRTVITALIAAMVALVLSTVFSVWSVWWLADVWNTFGVAMLQRIDPSAKATHFLILDMWSLWYAIQMLTPFYLPILWYVVQKTEDPNKGPLRVLTLQATTPVIIWAYTWLVAKALGFTFIYGGRV